jgi:two-component system sensor histidine kinase KdpD
VRASGAWGRPVDHLAALLAVGVTLAAVGAIQRLVPDAQTTILLYLLPLTLASTRWGVGPCITATLASAIGHDLLFVEPVGSVTVARLDEAIGLGLLIFTALVTSHLAIQARRATERAHEAEVAKQSDALKTALLRAVSHDLRTPLASIKASVSALRQPDTHYSDDDRAELLTAIEEETDHLTRLVADLLDVSRLEAGALAIHKQPQDLGELVDAVVRRLRPALGARSVAVDAPVTVPLVPYDYAQIDRVIANLVENAAVHTPPGTPVKIQLRHDDESAWVVVSDDGPGVPPEDRERIFQPFERGRGRVRGSGLGLAIARGLAEAHGGQLRVEGAPGGGARFVLTLPLATGPAETTPWRVPS